VSSALGDVRLIASGLRSPTFEAMTLAQVVERGVREHERRTGQSVALELDDAPADAPIVVKIGLYRVLQEALSNAARHAAGAAIDVRLAGSGDDVRLDVRDRGPGFDPATIRPDALGLAGMRERAELLGGSFSIGFGEDGRGTRVSLSLPLREGVHE
jgi:signal transduction histidine kinase